MLPNESPGYQKDEDEFFKQLLPEMNGHLPESEEDETIDMGELPRAVQIAHVERKMLFFEKSARYVEAEEQRLLLERLKQRSTKMDKEAFRKHWHEEYEKFHAEANDKQLAFGNMWEQRFRGQQQRERDLMKTLKQKHLNEIDELDERQKRRIHTPKYSMGLLEMRRKQYLLGKSKRYVEAERIRRKADVIEEREIKTYRKQCKEENERQKDRLVEKQLREVQVLKDKLAVERNHLVKMRLRAASRLQNQLQRAMKELKTAYDRSKKTDLCPTLPNIAMKKELIEPRPEWKAPTAQSVEGSTSGRIVVEETDEEGNVRMKSVYVPRLRIKALRRIASQDPKVPHTSGLHDISQIRKSYSLTER